MGLGGKGGGMGVGLAYDWGVFVHFSEEFSQAHVFSGGDAWVGRRVEGVEGVVVAVEVGAHGGLLGRGGHVDVDVRVFEGGFVAFVGRVLGEGVGVFGRCGGVGGGHGEGWRVKQGKGGVAEWRSECLGESRSIRAGLVLRK